MSRRRKAGISVISLAVLVLLGYLVYGFMNGPADGVVETPQHAAATVSPGFDLTPVSIVDGYGSFSVPAALTREASETVQPPILTSYRFSYQDTTSWRLTVSVSDVHTTAHQYSSSYQLRLDHPEQYTLTTQRAGNNQFNVMTDTSLTGFNKVAYQTQAGNEVQISLYGNGPTSATHLSKTFDMVLSTWQWR